MPAPSSPAAPSSVTALADLLRRGLPAPPSADDAARSGLEALFGDRYHSRHRRQIELRDACGRAAEPAHVPFAGLLPEGSSSSGPYGGMSLVWFPRKGGGSLLTFVVGTLGLSPDEGLLGRPGHRRRTAALRAHLRRLGVPAWTKSDPAAIGAPLPVAVQEAFPEDGDALRRYGPFVYACAGIDRDMPPHLAAQTVAAFLDIHAHERGWQVLAAYRPQSDTFLAALHAELFANPTAAEVTALLLERRFVVLQGAPGTGKTRMADHIRGGSTFQSRGLPVQFHPAVTYEDFVVGLAPQPAHAGLHFAVRPGWLLRAVEAAEAAGDRPYLLQIDEINRADLGKVLGEAIYLFEPGEDRAIALPHATNGRVRLRLPANLQVHGTMNTADRSIAGLNLAIRRRFAFATLRPDRAPVAAQMLPLAAEAFDRLAHAFVEHAADDALALLPGQAYYLAKTEAELGRRLRYELLPLLDEYGAAGLLGGAADEVLHCRDWMADRLAG